MTLTDIALQNLRRCKSKTAFLLLTFIVIVSVSVSLTALTKTMRDELQKSLSQYGANIVITPQAEHFTLSYGGLSVPGVNYELKHLDKDLDSKLANAATDLGITGIAPTIIGSASGFKNHYLIIGVDFPTELNMKPWWHIQGQLPKDGEIIIGAGLAQRDQLSIGSTLSLNGQTYPLVGVMQETGGSEDNGVFTTFKTARSLTGSDSWSMIELNASQPDKAAARLSKLIPQAKVSELSQLVQGTQESVDRFANFSLIASLLLGITGILIVFVTTTGNINDRSAEIGILRAIGFRRRHILSLLLREITLISLCGGVFGYLLGELLPTLLGPVIFHKNVAFQVQPLTALAALGLSVLAGILSVLSGKLTNRLAPGSITPQG